MCVCVCVLYCIRNLLTIFWENITDGYLVNCGTIIAAFEDFFVLFLITDEMHYIEEGWMDCPVNLE